MQAAGMGVALVSDTLLTLTLPAASTCSQVMLIHPHHRSAAWITPAPDTASSGPRTTPACRFT